MSLGSPKGSLCVICFVFCCLFLVPTIMVTTLLTNPVVLSHFNLSTNSTFSSKIPLTGYSGHGAAGRRGRIHNNNIKKVKIKYILFLLYDDQSLIKIIKFKKR